ncbi:MAG: GH39 family glycosyl hydrolase [Aeromicrobium sp.]
MTVDVDRPAGPAVRDLAGVTWYAGDLSLVSPLKPAFVRTDARLEEVSPQEGVLEFDALFERVDTILSVGSRPLILLNRMPSWLARPVPANCTQDRRGQAPCPPTAMGPNDLAAWEQLVEEIVRGLAERFDRDLAFEVWNEPNNMKSWSDSEELFIDTAMAMHRAIARVEEQTGLDLMAGGVALGEVGPLLSSYHEAAVKQGTPPDFISWHDYTRDPLDYRRDVEEVRTLIADPNLPLVITEWNHYGLKGDERNTAEGAAFNLASLIEMERAGVSQANFYRSVSVRQEPSDAGLVTDTGTPRPSWWSLQLWRSLKGDRLSVSGDDPEGGLWSRATRDGDQVDVILSSYADQGTAAHDVALDISGACDASTATVRRIDPKSSNFGSKREVDLDSLTMTMGNPAAVWVSVDCSGKEEATQIAPHPKSGVSADDGATENVPTWLILAGVGFLIAVAGVGARRRAKKKRAAGVGAGRRVRKRPATD